MRVVVFDFIEKAVTEKSMGQVMRDMAANCRNQGHYFTTATNGHPPIPETRCVCGDIRWDEWGAHNTGSR